MSTLDFEVTITLAGSGPAMAFGDDLLGVLRGSFRSSDPVVSAEDAHAPPVDLHLTVKADTVAAAVVAATQICESAVEALGGPRSAGRILHIEATPVERSPAAA